MLSCLSPRMPCCGPKAADEPEVLVRRERVDRVREVGGDGGRVREQRDAAAVERLAHGAVEQQAVDAELHRPADPQREGRRVVEVGLRAAMRERPVGQVAVVRLDDRGDAGMQRGSRRELRQRRDRRSPRSIRSDPVRRGSGWAVPACPAGCDRCAGPPKR